MRMIAILLLILASASVAGETIDYEIYEIEAGNDKRLLAKGAKDYSLDEIRQKPRGPGQTVYYIELEKGFSVGLVNTEEPEITGFALQAIHIDGGFSWDWFDLASGSVFHKRQECGEVSIRRTGLPGQYIIASVNFIEDVCLRLNQSDDPDIDTHRILVKKGSGLVVVP